MPIRCKDGSEPRFRVMEKNGKKYRVAFCGDKMVEMVPLKENKEGKLKKASKGKKLGKE